MQLRQVPSGSSRAVTPSDASAAEAGRASTESSAKQLGDYPETAAEVLSPSSRSSRLSKRNGEIPRNSHNIGLDEEVASDYEKRIAFIQKQHEKMLTALHREVEQLKRKNKGFMT